MSRASVLPRRELIEPLLDNFHPIGEVAHGRAEGSGEEVVDALAEICKPFGEAGVGLVEAGVGLVEARVGSADLVPNLAQNRRHDVQDSAPLVTHASILNRAARIGQRSALWESFRRETALPRRRSVEHRLTPDSERAPREQETTRARGSYRTGEAQ